MKTTVKLLTILAAIVAVVILANATPPPPEPSPKSLPCITNCEVYAWQSTRLGTFAVTDPQHCTTHVGLGHWKGTCLVAADCNNPGDAPLVSATLVPGYCGPETVGYVYVQCADGTENWCPLVVPAGALGAAFIIKGTCPPCGVTYCIKAYVPCGGQ